MWLRQQPDFIIDRVVLRAQRGSVSFGCNRRLDAYLSLPSTFQCDQFETG
jgi:hypothetical protein